MRKYGAVPSAPRRFFRDRARVTAVALLALVSIVAAGISATAAERLQQVLDENWRGTYDILVTAETPDRSLDGMLAPNTLAASAATLSLDDVEQIRGVQGVDVAAPLGEVVVLGFVPGTVQLAIPESVVAASSTPEAFRLTLTYWTDDGLGRRYVAQSETDVVVDPRPVAEPAPATCEINGVTVTPETYPELSKTCYFGPTRGLVNFTYRGGWGADGVQHGDVILFGLTNPMITTSRITLVDPQAERALLGDAGAFLDAFGEITGGGALDGDEALEWAERSDSPFADHFLGAHETNTNLGYTPEQLAEYERLNEEPGATGRMTFEAPLSVPLLVRDVGPSPLTAEVSVLAFGHAADAAETAGGFPYVFPADMGSDGAGVTLGSAEADASVILNPALPRAVVVPWPGEQLDGIENIESPATMYLPMVGSVNAAEFAARDGASFEVELVGAGFVSPAVELLVSDNPLPLFDDGSQPGLESVFWSGVEFVNPIDPEKGPGPTPRALAIGSFDVDAILELQDGLGRVPLGAYERVGSTLVSGSSRDATDAVEMQPSISGLGIVSHDTVAIASLASADFWGEDAPVSAVRVRVGGIEGFTPDSVAKVAGVAQAIERLGFSATIVSGSSPREVLMHIDNYAFGVTDPTQQQEVGYLGAVTQEWSELGAASRIDLAVSNTSFAVLAVALGAAALLLAAVQLAGVPRRRAQSSVMRTIGWSRLRIVRWLAADELVSLVLIALAGAMALLLASSRATVNVAVGGSVAALIVTSALAVALGARPQATGSRSLRKVRGRRRKVEAQAWVTSPGRLALRQVTVHRVNAIVQLIATAVVAVATAAITVTLVEGSIAAGESALGVFAVDEARIAQLGLGGIALAAGIVLAVIARRIDLARRLEHWSTLRAMGWSRAEVRRVQLYEGLIIAVPATVTATGLAWWYTHLVAPELVSAVIVVALAAALVLTAILVVTNRRDKA